MISSLLIITKRGKKRNKKFNLNFTQRLSYSSKPKTIDNN